MNFLLPFVFLLALIYQRAVSAGFRPVWDLIELSFLCRFITVERWLYELIAGIGHENETSGPTAEIGIWHRDRDRAVIDP